jgi:hypothetical protein
MNQETRDGLHNKLEEVLNLADEETLKFIDKLCEMVLSELVLAKIENQRPEVHRKLFGAKNGPPMIFCGPF